MAAARKGRCSIWEGGGYLATTTLLKRHANEGETIADAIRDCLDYGKIPKRQRTENTFPHTNVIRPQWPPSSFWQRPAIKPSQAGSRRRTTISCAIRYANLSFPGRLRRRRRIVSGMSWLYVGQKAAMPLSSPHIRTRNTFTVTFITIQRP